MDLGKELLDVVIFMCQTYIGIGCAFALAQIIGRAVDRS